VSVVDGYGFIVLSRKLFDSHLWQEERSLSRFEAWVDLLQTAAWKDHERRIRGRVVAIPRGSLVASERFLMRRWGWKSVGKVRRFLGALVNDGRIERDPKTEQLSITNYDSYQGTRSSDGAVTEQSRSSHGAVTEQREVREKKEKKVKKGRIPPAFPPGLVAAIPNIEVLWAERMRCARVKPSEPAEQTQIDELADVCRKHGPGPVLKAIQDATLGGYQGIFPDKHTPNSGGPSRRPPTPGSDESRVQRSRDIDRQLGLGDFS
jgi:hypothetical protein